MAIYCKNTKKDFIMRGKIKEDYTITNVCRKCEKNIESDKFRDHCHLTGKYRGPAHSNCNINFTQDQSNFLPFVSHNFRNYVCHLSF